MIEFWWHQGIVEMYMIENGVVTSFDPDGEQSASTLLPDQVRQVCVLEAIVDDSIGGGDGRT